MRNRFAVVIICDRDVMAVTLWPNMKKAVDKANRALTAWVKDQLHLGPGKLPPDILEEKGDDWERATSKNRNAWCNYKSYDWNAHIIDLDDL